MAEITDEKPSSVPQANNISNEKSPIEVLQKFLDSNNLELRLTSPSIRQIENGGLLIDQPQIAVNFKQSNSITPVKENKN